LSDPTPAAGSAERESRAWIERLRSNGSQRDRALVELHALLLRSRRPIKRAHGTRHGPQRTEGAKPGMNASSVSNDRADLLARLTGPAGPEISCEECFERLDLYVEFELAGSDAEAAVPGMRAHLEGCPACAEDRESLRALLVSESGSEA
jgi:hypothetical protein